MGRITPPEEIEAEARSFAADMLHATPLGLRLTKEALGHAIDAAEECPGECIFIEVE